VVLEARVATLEDIPAMVDIFVAVAAERIWIGTEPPVDRERRTHIFEALIGGEGAVFVAVAADEVVGHLAVHGASGARELGMVVADGWRGKGAGRALLSAAVAWARAQPGVHKLCLEVWPHNGAALALYRRFGFEVEGRRRRQYRRKSGELWDSIPMGLVLDETSPGSPYEDA
jgi:RimJ/RimL family protein N-acetyltransferase